MTQRPSREDEPHPADRGPRRPRRPVHVAARGAVSCFGNGYDRLIDAVFSGETGVRPLDRLRGTDCLTRVAGEVPAPIAAEVQCPEELALAVARIAASEALSEWSARPDDRTLLCVASTKADMSGIISPHGRGLGSPAHLTRQLATALDWTGPTIAISCACASGLTALAWAGREIRAGRADTALVVGADALSAFVLRGFSSLLALSEDGARPFDRDRDGLSLGEGAGAIVLSAAPAPHIGVVLAGSGESNDANHVTGPCRDGSGLALAIDRAFLDAGAVPEDVGFVHLHGTGTPYNDSMESRAVERTFDQPPLAVGSKGQIGHTLGAAGLLETLIALAGIERGEVPPTVGLEQTEPGCAMVLRSTKQPLTTPSFLKVAAGFGGINAALFFRRGTTADAPGPAATVTAEPLVCRASEVNAHELRSSAGRSTTWEELSLAPIDGRVSFQPIFDEPNRGFRRMDRTAKLFYVAAELADLKSLTPDERAGTAIVLASTRGCLAADLRFEASLRVPQGVQPGVFPYTLPSTVLGEIAIRHRLRGPTLCISAEEGGEAAGLRAASTIIREGTAQAALVLLGDWFAPERENPCEIADKTRIVALLLRPRDSDTPCSVTLDDVETLLARAEASSSPLATIAETLSPKDPTQPR